MNHNKHPRLYLTWNDFIEASKVSKPMVYPDPQEDEDEDDEGAVFIPAYPEILPSIIVQAICANAVDFFAVALDKLGGKNAFIAMGLTGKFIESMISTQSSLFADIEIADDDPSETSI